MDMSAAIGGAYGRPMAYGYVRASTDRQTLTIAAQKRRIEDAVRGRELMRDWPYGWGGWFEDASISASIDWFERPEGQNIVRTVKPGDVIVVANFDRAFRSVKNLCETLATLQEMNVSLWLLDMQVDTGTAMGRAFAQMFAVLKEYELREISRRTREVSLDRIRQRKPGGGNYAPIGWRKQGKKARAVWVPYEIERRWCHVVVRMRHIHNLSFDKIQKLTKKARKYRGTLISEWSRPKLFKAYVAARIGFPILFPNELPYPEALGIYRSFGGDNEYDPSVRIVSFEDRFGVQQQFVVRPLPDFARIPPQYPVPSLYVSGLRDEPYGSLNPLRLGSSSCTQP